MSCSYSRMPIDTRWFQDLLTDRRLSQRRLAREIGIDPSAVSLMFRGKRRMQMAEAAQVARLLGVPLDDVIRHAGIHTETMAPLDIQEIAVPLVYMVDGHAELHSLDAGQRVEVKAALPDDVIAAQCRTAMTPLEHMDRWLLLFSAPTRSGIQPDAIGRYSVMRLPGGMMTIGYIRPGYERGKYAIHRGASVTEAAIEWATPIRMIVP